VNPFANIDTEREARDTAARQEQLRNDPDMQWFQMTRPTRPMRRVNAGLDLNAGSPAAPQNMDEDRNADAAAAPVRVAEPQFGHRDRNHEGWRFVHGAGDCEHCGGDTAAFLMECETCQMRACLRCTLNRL
jgi:hypothetical protein